MTFKIDKDIPLPTRLYGRAVKKYPWPDMEVGDSIFIEGLSTRIASVRWHAFSKKTGRKFRSAAENGGVRIWRIE